MADDARLLTCEDVVEMRADLNSDSWMDPAMQERWKNERIVATLEALMAERETHQAQLRELHDWGHERLCDLEAMHQRETAGLRDRIRQLSDAVAYARGLHPASVIIQAPEGWTPPSSPLQTHSCGATFSEQDNFCGGCGQAVRLTCVACSQPLNDMER